MNLKRQFLCCLAMLTVPGIGYAQVPSVVRVEIDYMEDAFHTHRPTQQMIDAWVQIFACHGIELRIVVSDAIPHQFLMRCPEPGVDDFFECEGPESFLAIKEEFANEADETGWHYCVIGHQYDNGDILDSSGLAEGHDDFVVTLGAFAGGGTPFQIASTFVHELGHNLGLGHTSALSTVPDGPFAPNYASVMSYRYQLNGVRSGMEASGFVSSAHLFKEIDFSNGRLVDLSELNLDEQEGCGIKSVDWDCNGNIESPIQRDLDAEEPACVSPTPPRSYLDDYDDWSNIRDLTHVQESTSVGRPRHRCISASEHAAMLAEVQGRVPLRGSAASAGGTAEGQAPVLAVESCVVGEMVFVSDSTAIGTGTGDFPFGNLDLALPAAPDHSILYLAEGTYDVSGSQLIISRPLTFAGPGTAIIDP